MEDEKNVDDNWREHARQAGIEVLDEMIKQSFERGYSSCELKGLSEFHFTRDVQTVNGKRYETYRMYQGGALVSSSGNLIKILNRFSFEEVLKAVI